MNSIMIMIFLWHSQTNPNILEISISRMVIHNLLFGKLLKGPGHMNGTIGDKKSNGSRVTTLVFDVVLAKYGGGTREQI